MQNKTLTNNPSGENNLEVPVVNFPFNKQPPKQPNKEWIIISGIATSEIRTKQTTDTPAYIFFRLKENNKHTLTQCINSKCKSCEIPVVFRIKKEQKFIKPKINKDDSLQLAGYFADTPKPRPSFTCYSYQLL